MVSGLLNHKLFHLTFFNICFSIKLCCFKDYTKLKDLLLDYKKNILWLNFKQNISVYQYIELFMRKEILYHIQIHHLTFLAQIESKIAKSL